ncbi:sensor histidine kinase [Novilysobacter spongiicola]|uniref:histidine kinase n=1 Tax=Lysobacter spongiicola DSM 21749 TaxID=1122188 RepID=A0A1T4MCJ8_9GAMM|nr:histidine kinase dimerization/phospho-acceptor domain-containing protein [Lysobacter spongiicola]SJZ64518.1 His Kinase A (phospho-acceptor) domain-containing protein [Lysobacter spongiicola DSM 21749]
MPDASPDHSVDLLERLAHDLRGPLSPLQTAAYLLRRDDVDPQRQKELLEIIDRQTSRLSGMVQEVSDWMRARKARLVGTKEPLGVPMLVELVCATRPAVSVDLPESLDEANVLGDAQRLTQMLGTLLDWAQALDPQGTITLRASRDGEVLSLRLAAPPVEGGMVQLDGLFRMPQAVPFDEGLGMRLLIAREIATAHGGEITGEGGTDGTTVVVRLPLDE